MKQYNHMITIAFEVESNHPDGDDITPDQFKEGIAKCILNIEAEQGWVRRMVAWKEACLPPDDTFEIDDEYRFEVVATDESGTERIGEYDTLANAVAEFARLVEDNSHSDGRNPYTAFAIRPIGEVKP